MNFHLLIFISVMIKDVCNLCESGDPYDFTCVIPDNTITNQILSYLMLVITTISLGTQPISQLIKKTSKGLSSGTWQVSIFAFWIQTLNMIVTESAKYFAFQNDPYAAFIALIPHFNTLLCVIYCILIIYLYLYYYRIENGIDKHYIQQFLIFMAQLIFILVSFAICFGTSIAYGECNTGLKVISYITMIVGCVLSCIQEIPQIITTYKLKSGGALSLLSQLAQPPANIYTFVLYFFQDVNIISWIQLLVFSVLQTILCVLQVYYDVYLPRKARKYIQNIEQ